VSVSEYQEFAGKPDPREAVTIKQAADEWTGSRGDLATYGEGAKTPEVRQVLQAVRDYRGA